MRGRSPPRLNRLPALNWREPTASAPGSDSTGSGRRPTTAAPSSTRSPKIPPTTCSRRCCDPEPEAGSDLIEDYPYRTTPARDGSPYFHAFLRPAHVGDYWSALRANEQGFGEWGELTLAAALASALVLGSLGILLPACLQPRARRVLRHSGRPSLYFLGLGLAYLMVEIVWIQQGVLLTGEPTLTAMAVIATFLAGSGAGALTLARSGAPPRVHPGIVVCGLILLAAAAWPAALQRLLRAPPSAAWAAVIGSALPLAFAMGRPLPVGVDRFARDDPPLLCWCLALNGWTSVIAPLVTTVLAAAAGFRAALVTAALVYLACALTSRRASTPRTG